MQEHQQTIKKSFALSGIGIHSGLPATITVLPAKEGTGINFKVVDVSPPLIIPAKIASTVKTERKTSLKKNQVEIQTVEHLMAAAYALEIDNLLIEISGGEVPVLDGSALPFIQAFKNAGVLGLPHPRKIFTTHSPIAIENHGGEATLLIAPLDRLRISFVVDLPVIGSQFFSFDSDQHDFEQEIAPARTFGLEKDLALLREKGLAKGASLENALGISKKGYLTPPRFKNEPVRHKILDLIGDLALLGGEIKGHVIAIKSGHKLNLELIERLEIIYE